MAEKLVLLDATRDGLAVITLNRPEAQNAVNAEVLDALVEAIDELRGADGVRTIILEGAGESFCGGEDPSWAKYEADYTRDDYVADAKALGHCLGLWRQLPKPTLALVRGAALGPGMALAAASDIAVADHSAYFACPEVRHGFVPGVVLPFVVEAIGARAARRYMVTGERIDAAEALRLGLVHAVVPDQAAMASLSERLVAAIFEAAPSAAAGTKLAVGIVDRQPIDHILLADMARRVGESRADVDGREGLAALLEKRKPRWAQ